MLPKVAEAGGGASPTTVGPAAPGPGGWRDPPEGPSTSDPVAVAVNRMLPTSPTDRAAFPPSAVTSRCGPPATIAPSAPISDAAKGNALLTTGAAGLKRSNGSTRIGRLVSNGAQIPPFTAPM